MTEEEHRQLQLGDLIKGKFLGGKEAVVTGKTPHGEFIAVSTYIVTDRHSWELAAVATYSQPRKPQKTKG